MQRLGATPDQDGHAEFRVWAPDHPGVAVRVNGELHPLDPAEDGTWSARVEASPGDDYVFALGDRELPDPCSRFQPDGIRGRSRVVRIPDVRPGPPLELEELVLYELHVGCFTDEGTFDAVVPHLTALCDLGVTAIELMPVGTFPGTRNWGYDGVYVYAPHPVHGGPEGLARLVDAAHETGLGVLIDVVYNHLGPGSDAISAFGPYLTDRHETSWGPALDYSQQGVREWALQNAELWTREYGIDGLRLDAVHAVYDDSPVHVLKELRGRVDGLVISEMGSEDFRPLDEWGHDAMWLDSLHHHLHVLLTGERDGYYESFGSEEGLVRELTRDHPERLVVCAQNHDQVGNRALGDRLAPAVHRVALAVVLFATTTPLLFMGEEYDEARPFRFFTDHVDAFVADATREGRRREFAEFAAFSGEDVPDPQDPETFLVSKLDRREPNPLYRELLELRRVLPRELEVRVEDRRLTLQRGNATLVADLDARTVELRRAA
jgi:maltooligosyltrehalose trehalohydrolase